MRHNTQFLRDALAREKYLMTRIAHLETYTDDVVFPKQAASYRANWDVAVTVLKKHYAKNIRRLEEEQRRGRVTDG